jgi:hypothetical protein
MNDHPKEPLEAFADDSIKADIQLNERQREALTNIIGDLQRRRRSRGHRRGLRKGAFLRRRWQRSPQGVAMGTLRRRGHA